MAIRKPVARSTTTVSDYAQAWPRKRSSAGRLVERSFALLDRRGMRRSWLRGREPAQRYLVHVAGYGLGLIMRLLIGAGTPRDSWAAYRRTWMLLTTLTTPSRAS